MNLAQVISLVGWAKLIEFFFFCCLTQTSAQQPVHMQYTRFLWCVSVRHVKAQIYLHMCVDFRYMNDMLSVIQYCITVLQS